MLNLYYNIILEQAGNTQVYYTHAFFCYLDVNILSNRALSNVMWQMYPVLYTVFRNLQCTFIFSIRPRAAVFVILIWLSASVCWYCMETEISIALLLTAMFSSNLAFSNCMFG